jgi:hypothetical protein
MGNNAPSKEIAFLRHRVERKIPGNNYGLSNPNVLVLFFFSQMERFSHE